MKKLLLLLPVLLMLYSCSTKYTAINTETGRKVKIVDEHNRVLVAGDTVAVFKHSNQLFITDVNTSLATKVVIYKKH